MLIILSEAGIPLPGGLMNKTILEIVISQQKFAIFALEAFRKIKNYLLIAEGSLIQSPLLPSRATVQIFPGKKCRLCFSPFHSGTVFTRVPLPVTLINANRINDMGSQNLMLMTMR